MSRKPKEEPVVAQMIIKTDDEKNIKALAIAIIEQACNDYEYILNHGERGERRIGQSKLSLERFFWKNDSYFKYLDISGPAMLKQMKENYAVYGQVRIPIKKKNKNGKDVKNENE